MPPVRMRKLGSNGPELSVVGFGAWEAGGTDWGPNESDESVVAAIRAAIDTGITWIDTAEVYGNGVSETLVGKAVAGRRDELVIATKVAPADEGSGFRPDQVRAACEASLGRLGLDHIDLYQLHWPDPFDTPVEETWGAMAELQEAGSVRFVGVSNFDRQLIERCERIRHVDSLQQEFSMLERGDRELIRWCGGAGTGVVSYGPLAFGLLTGAIDHDTAFAPGDWRSERKEGPFADLGGSLAFVDRLRPIAERLGVTLGQLAIAWNVAQPGVTAAIAGSRNPEHVRENAAAGNLELSAGTIAAIESLFPD